MLCNRFHRLQLPIRQATPQPFQRPELEVTQPNRRDHELEYPNCYNNAELLSAWHFAEQSETVPVEDGRANNGLHDVVGKGHSAHRCQLPSNTGQSSGSRSEHHQTDPPEADQQAGPVVVKTPIEGGKADVPVMGKVNMNSVQGDWNAQKQGHSNQSCIQLRRGLSTEEPKLEESHTGQHQPKQAK